MTVTDGGTDNELVSAIASGDKDAFQVLFRRFLPDISRYSYSILLDSAAAEDVAQETFVKLWNGASHWKPDAKIKTWLLTVARNACIDSIRKRNNDSKKCQKLVIENTGSLQSDEGTLDRDLDREKFKHVIKNTVFSLPERQREAISLVYYSDTQNCEAAQIMGMSPAAFDSLLARARRNLHGKFGVNKDELSGSFINDK